MLEHTTLAPGCSHPRQIRGHQSPLQHCCCGRLSTLFAANETATDAPTIKTYVGVPPKAPRSCSNGSPAPEPALTLGLKAAFDASAIFTVVLRFAWWKRVTTPAAPATAATVFALGTCLWSDLASEYMTKRVRSYAAVAIFLWLRSIFCRGVQISPSSLAHGCLHLLAMASSSGTFPEIARWWRKKKSAGIVSGSPDEDGKERQLERPASNNPRSLLQRVAR